MNVSDDIARLSETIPKFTYFRGRVALYSLLRGLGVGAGDEVAIQAFTCIAVPEGVLATGARPVYIDVERAGLNMDPVDLDKRISPSVRAVVVQHTFGIPANMDSIMDIARRAGIPVIEDCCHSLDSKLSGRQIGTFGVGSFYSFEWGKPVVAGMGGSAVANNPELIAWLTDDYVAYHRPGSVRQMKIALQYLAFQAIFRPSCYWMARSLFHKLSSLGAVERSYNDLDQETVDRKDFELYMAQFSQRLLVKKLARASSISEHSRKISDSYRAKILSKGVSHLEEPPDANVTYARYPMFSASKPDLLSKARHAKVELADWYSTPVHPYMGTQLRHVNYETGQCPNAEANARQIVSLPTHPKVSQRDVDRAIEFLNGLT